MRISDWSSDVCSSYLCFLQVWCKPVTFSCFEPDSLAQGIWYDQYVRKKDRSVETKSPQRLQCDLSRCLAVIDQLETAAFFRSKFTIFRQIAPRLPHQPDRRHVLFFPAQYGEQFLGGWIGQAELSF